MTQSEQLKVMMRVHMEQKDKTECSISIIYALCLTFQNEIDWRSLHTIIAEGLKMDMQSPEWLKKRNRINTKAWDFHGRMANSEGCNK